MYLGVLYGSYKNFTRSTCCAIKEILGDKIAWPMGSEKVMSIAYNLDLPRGSNSGQTRVRLPSVIGALNGKNVIIHKPSPAPYGDMFWDRKNNYSVKLTAVCLADCRSSVKN